MSAIAIEQLPNNEVVLSNDHLYEAQWYNKLLRIVIPFYASIENRKISEFFITYFKNTPAISPAVIDLADRYAKVDPELMRYTLAARFKLNYFDADHPIEELKSLCQAKNAKLYQKWCAQKFERSEADREIFFTHPDLVDFIFQGHLHRHIRHQDYLHHIEMIGDEPNLLMEREGRAVPTPWSQIKPLISIGADQNLYSTDEQGRKRQWMYLNKGFVQHDPRDLEHAHPFKVLDDAPDQCQVQIITTIAHQEDWLLFDHLMLKGIRHAFFRVIFNKKFEERHPGSHFKSGEVYSVNGCGGLFGDLFFLRPLMTIPATRVSPDGFEFYPQDLFVTTLPIDDDKALRLIDVIQPKEKREMTYHCITNNCCTQLGEILKEADIIDIQTKDHMITLWYKLLLPEFIRNYIDKVSAYLKKYTPQFIQKGIFYISTLLHSVLFVPLFILMGAWRGNMRYEEESVSKNPENPSEAMLRTSNRAKALFSNFYDMFDPNKMTFDLPTNIYLWQKRQQELNPASCEFIQKN